MLDAIYGVTRHTIRLSSRASVKVIAVCLLMDEIEERLRRKPAGKGRSDCLVCIDCVLFINLDRLVASTTRGRIGCLMSALGSKVPVTFGTYPTTGHGNICPC